MEARPRGPEQDDLLRPRLTEMIDMCPGLVTLVALIDRDCFERGWTPFAARAFDATRNSVSAAPGREGAQTPGRALDRCRPRALDHRLGQARHPL